MLAQEFNFDQRFGGTRYSDLRLAEALNELLLCEAGICTEFFENGAL